MSNSILFLGDSFPWDNDPFYNFGSDYEKQAFKEWFIKNAKKYTNNPFYNFEPNLIKQIFLSGCYGNSQYIAINTMANYVEGLVWANGTYTFNEYIPHGFNTINNKVVDYSYKKILQEAPRYLSKMPTEYWGIEIPKEYILSSNGDNKDKPQDFHRPLLLLYWRDMVEGD